MDGSEQPSCTRDTRASVEHWPSSRSCVGCVGGSSSKKTTDLCETVKQSIHRGSLLANDITKHCKMLVQNKDDVTCENADNMILAQTVLDTSMNLFRGIHRQVASSYRKSDQLQKQLSPRMPPHWRRLLEKLSWPVLFCCRRGQRSFASDKRARQTAPVLFRFEDQRRADSFRIHYASP